MKNGAEVFSGNEGWAPSETGSQQQAFVKPPAPPQREIPRPLTTAEFQELMRQSEEAGDWMLNQLTAKALRKI
ncbi:hypothetical protein PSE10A_52460 [Pseudomonas amygdali pv. eriobotryae]|uniref:Uncharacterized protein n=1 Tax=Pseudomonas amygdali pv. eriobotryae TaxID=129137 RepID=A0A9P3EFA2_PSEA0|nr:hypothetical protein PSE10A_52460 [Pseudomonas amygdali pv. eriobotryae]